MSYVKKPCQHCPFRTDVTPFLHPERAAQIAYSAENPYSNFPCHKTLEYDEDNDELFAGREAKECAGFLTLRAQSGLKTPDGFNPSWEICYIDSYGMIDAYEQEWENQHNKTNPD